MSKSLCITIDVEPDCDTKWRRSNPLTFSNVEEGIGEVLPSLFAKCGGRPTYLISPEVLNHQASVDVLGSLGDCELGTHLHSEYIGASIKYPDPAGTASNEFPSSLGREVQLEKLTAITELFEQKFGYRPASYRAARFGANADTFEHLVSLGYLVDTSVTPATAIVLAWVNILVCSDIPANPADTMS